MHHSTSSSRTGGEVRYSSAAQQAGKVISSAGSQFHGVEHVENRIDLFRKAAIAPRHANDQIRWRDKEDTYSGISQLIIGRDRRSRCQRRWYKACSNLETVSMPKGPYFVRSGYPQYPCLGFGHDFIQPDFAECRARGRP